LKILVQQTRKCSINGAYLDEWIGDRGLNDLKDYLGNEIDIGDIVVFPASGNFGKGKVISFDSNNELIIKNSNDYKKTKYPRDCINLTKIDDVFKIVYPEKYIYEKIMGIDTDSVLLVGCSFEELPGDLKEVLREDDPDEYFEEHDLTVAYPQYDCDMEYWI